MINKRKAIRQMSDYGDSIVNFSNGREAVCVTTDFKNKYIRSIRRTERFSLKSNVLVFNWSENKFEAIPVKDIHSITPLSQILKNVGRDNDGR